MTIVTVYDHLCQFDEKQKQEGKPQLMAELRLLLAKYPDHIKYRILPKNGKPVAGENNLLYSVMTMDRDDLSGLAKPGFLGLFSKLGALGPGLALQKRYTGFIDLIRARKPDKEDDPEYPELQATIKKDMEYFRALQEVMDHIYAKKDLFLKYLSSIEHVSNYSMIISNDLKYIDGRLTKICFDYEFKLFAVREGQLAALNMSVNNTDHEKNVRDVIDISKEVAKLKLLDAYPNTDHHNEFQKKCAKSLEAQLTAYCDKLEKHAAAVLKNSKLSSGDLQKEVNNLNAKHEQLVEFQKAFAKHAIDNKLSKKISEKVSTHFYEAGEKIKEFAGNIQEKQQEVSVQEFAVAQAAAKAAAQKAAEQRRAIGHMSARERDIGDEKDWGKTATRGRSGARGVDQELDDLVATRTRSGPRPPGGPAGG